MSVQFGRLRALAIDLPAGGAGEVVPNANAGDWVAAGACPNANGASAAGCDGVAGDLPNANGDGAAGCAAGWFCPKANGEGAAGWFCPNANGEDGVGWGCPKANGD